MVILDKPTTHFNGIMTLNMIAFTEHSALFKRVIPGYEDYWVVGYNPVFCGEKVTWQSGNYFNGTKEKALEILQAS